MFDFFAPCLRCPYRPYAIPLGIEPFGSFFDQPILFRYQFCPATVIAMNDRNTASHRFHDRESTAFTSRWQHGDIAGRVEIAQLVARIFAVKGGDDGVTDAEIGREGVEIPVALRYVGM